MTLRITPLDGALNFRDLGGYRSVDGRSVRWATVYRSGSTHALTADDIARLRALGIRHAYDLRSNIERRQLPTRLTHVPELQYHCRDHQAVPGDIRRLLALAGAGPELGHRMMIGLYRSLPGELAPAYRELFGHLAAKNLPLVFNCTAGKDRTGVAAALLLVALGVPRDVVFEDYLATAQFYEQTRDLFLSDPSMALARAGDPSVWEPLLRVHEDYLAAMFGSIDDTCGSVQGYFEQRLGIDATALDRLRSTLLE